MSKRNSVIPTDKVVITAVNGKTYEFDVGTKNPSLVELKRALGTSEWGALMDHTGNIRVPGNNLTFWDLPAGSYTTVPAPRKIKKSSCSIL